MAPRRNIKRRRTKQRRRIAMPSRPPPISINPWRKVTLSLEQEGNGSDICVAVQDIKKALYEQLAVSFKSVEIRMHRVRMWNRGSPPLAGTGPKGYDVEVPSTCGPLLLSVCDLVSNMASQSCAVTYLRTIESYPGRASWAKASYSWTGPSSRLILGVNGKAVVFVFKAPPNETVVFHLIVSYRSVSSGSFTEAALRVTHPCVTEKGTSLVDDFDQLDTE